MIDVYLNKLREVLPEPVKQLAGLVSLTLIVILSFTVLNIFFGQGEELVEKMKKEEVRIAEANKLSKIISTLPSGILTFYEGSDHYTLSKEQYETVCKITTIIPQRAVMGANLINFKANKLYTINGNKIDDTFVKWDNEKNRCFAGFTVSGSNIGINESVTVSGEVLNFLSTGIDTRVYFIKNF
ncbi:hypothetical protein OAO09_04910 [Candidatus Pelagibacter sp.]|jgi:hypothetical protein|nr:hypothetical protein [Candidatus Pelagibacter sp.]